MKLCALDLHHFRKFDHPVRVEGFAPGLNLLAGPNETGKSTILAALHAVLFERHRAAGEHIRALQTHGHQTGPFVALEFELDGRRHRIEKRFLRAAQARLHLADGRRLEGDAAEEEMQRLLGFVAPGNRGITAEQQGVWSLLMVPQGGAFAQPEIADGTRRSLEGALGAELGAVLGSGEAGAVARAVEQARRELIDGHRRPKGRYAAAIERSGALASEIERLEGIGRRVAAWSEELEGRRRRLAALQDGREEALLLRQCEEARERRERLRARHEQIRAALARCELARHEQARLASELEQRAELERAIAGLREEGAAGVPAAALARDALAGSERSVDDLERRCSQLEEAREDAARKLARGRRLQALLAEDETLRRLQACQREVETASAQGRAFTLESEAIRVDEAMLADLVRAARAVERAEVALQAVATTLRFEVSESARGRVRVDGVPLDAARGERRAIEATRIEIEDVGAITVTPQIADGEQLARQLETARRSLRHLLAEAGVADLETAGARVRERQRLLAEAELARHRARLAVSAVLPGVGSAGELRDQIERRSALALRERAELDGEGAVDPQEMAGRIAACEAAIARLDQDLRETRALLEGAREERERQRRARARLGVALRRVGVAREALERRLGEAESRHPRGALETDLAHAAATLADEERSLAALRAEAAEADPELVESEIARLTSAIEQRRAEAGELRVEIGRLQAQIEQHEGVGLDEQIEDARRRQGLCERERAACAREVQALSLLLDTLAEAEREAKERYLRPVALRLRPYLRGLYPGAEVVVDESLRIVTLGREGSQEPFEQLSDGTREQVAVLVRLAFAELLADHGGPAVVVLDDALAFSDDDRLEQMFTLLHHAARRLQIVVLTCRERAFESLGASRLRIVETAPDAAAAD